MKSLQSLVAITAAVFFSTSAIADDAKPAEWLFVHTAQTAEMTSDTTLVMPVTRDIFAFTDRPNRMHAYMNAHEYVSLWDEGEGDTFKADPPNAVLTWVDGDEMKEAELLIISAETVSHGREIAYEVKLEAGDMPEGNIGAASFFVDDGHLKCMLAGGWAFPRACRTRQARETYR
jgi:hypothetical protein